MKSIIYCTVLILISVMLSCGSKNTDRYSDKTVAAEFSESNAVEQTDKFSAPTVTEDEIVSDKKNAKPENIIGDSHSVAKKIIKDGSISIRTTDIVASKKALDNLIKSNGAYYETENLENNDQTISYNLKVRVPVSKFEVILSGLENGKDEITSKSIQARDVTEEYVDIKTRLTNKKEYLQRYKELLAKASTVKDILAIEESVRVLQEEIESQEGRLNYLNDQIAFSTISIYLYKEKEFIYKPQTRDSFLERVKRSGSNGWTSFIDIVLWTISILPVLALIAAIILIFKQIVKFRRRKQAKTNSQ